MTTATDLTLGRISVPGGDVPVKNTDAVAMKAGHLVKLDTAHAMSASQGAPGVLLTTAVTDKPYGFICEAIPVGGFGRCQRLGHAVAIAAGAINVDDVVGPSGVTPGAITAYTATDPSCGSAETPTTTLNDPIRVAIAFSRNA